MRNYFHMDGSSGGTNLDTRRLPCTIRLHAAVADSLHLQQVPHSIPNGTNRLVGNKCSGQASPALGQHTLPAHTHSVSHRIRNAHACQVTSYNTPPPPPIPRNTILSSITTKPSLVSTSFPYG
ncbi:hypothetical protein BaRGS_00016325 [Batillaria attramentaria]|uniref:Uncharacterized protein n=1 Tax=Batillaria attramentaria TaxID=370345 RepID=A0ABD0KYZ3_9CAEN